MLSFWKKLKPQKIPVFVTTPTSPYEPDLTKHKELTNLPDRYPAELIFSFCLSCGQDCLVWPGKCPCCGSKEYKYLGTVQGIIWRTRKFPNGGHNFRNIKPLSDISVKNCHRYQDILRYIKQGKGPSKEYNVFYTAYFTKKFTDVEYLAQVAEEIQIGIRHLVIRAIDMDSKLDPKTITVEAVQNFENGELKSGVYFNARIQT